MTTGEMANLYAAIAGRATVREVAEILAGEGILVAPLKGALLHATGCAAAGSRPMVDVDVLVPAHQHARARAALVRAGWTVCGIGTAADMLRKGDRPLVIDLHQRLYPYQRFGPRTESVLARARVDRSAFGVDVLLMDPLDLYAHLVAHFAKDRRDERQARTLVDLGRVADVHALAPAEVAARLDAEGLGRAARYTLTMARDHLGDGFAADVLARLERDPVGDAIAAIARRAVRMGPQPTKLAAIPVALLDRSVAESARSLAAHARWAVGRAIRRARR